MYYVGIDWADKAHQVCILGPKREIIKEFVISHSHQGFTKLTQTLKLLNCQKEQISIICETKHNLLISYLIQHQYQVYCVNPKSIDRFRDTKRASTTKSDKFDAYCLADYLAINKDLLKPLTKSDPCVEELLRLSRFYNLLVKRKTAVVNSLKSYLKSYYPLSLELFNIDSKIFFQFLKSYPTPTSLAAENEKGFYLFLKEAHYSWPQRAKELYKKISLEQIQVDHSTSKVVAKCVLMLVDELKLYCEQIKEIQKAIEETVNSYPPAVILKSLPGMGAVTAAGIIAELGEPGRYSSASAVQCLAGTAPVTRQSGNFKYVRMRKSCNKQLRNKLQQFAFVSIQNCKWAKDFYDLKIKAGKKHHAAIRALANKWVSIIYAMYEKNKPYNEDIYLLNKKRFNKVSKKPLVEVGLT